MTNLPAFIEAEFDRRLRKIAFYAGIPFEDLKKWAESKIDID